MGQLYNISVVNTEPGCDNNFIQKTVSITGCSETIVLRLNAASNAVGPFDIYTGATSSTVPVFSGKTKAQMVQGVSVELAGDDPGACTDPTPTPTPSVTATPTPTPTPTLTPTQTPTQSQGSLNAYLFIETQEFNDEIGQYLYDTGVNFFGFSNLSVPDTTDATNFNNEMNEYVSFSGWGENFPSVRQQSVPLSSGGVDSFGQPIVAFNFTTHQVPAGTVTGPAWYTWIIPVAATNNGIQTAIDYNSNGNVGNMVTVNMESTLYSQTFTYTGSVIPTGTYRVYSTFGDLSFYLDNSAETLYFRGNTVV